MNDSSNPPSRLTAQFFSARTLRAATTLSPAQKPQLPLLNPIHPIFSLQNFPTLHPLHYADLIPALRLASRFLTSPLLRPWWATLLLGSPCPSHTHANATVLARVPLTRRSKLLTSRLLEMHALKITFKFRSEDSSFASTHTEDGRKIVYLDIKHFGFLAATGEGGYIAAGRAQKLRFQLHVALNLAHEIAHSCWNDVLEPFHSEEDPEQELGHSWESFMFSGGKVQPVNFDVTCREGLMWYRWVEQREEERILHERGERFWTVDMRWVEDICGEEMWWTAERTGRREALDVRLVKRSGAASPYSQDGHLQVLLEQDSQSRGETSS